MTTETEIDPLAQPLGGVDLSRPLALAGNYEMVITEAKVERNKRNDGDNLVLKVKSTREIKSTKGDVINAGALVLTKYAPTQAAGKMTTVQVVQSFGRLQRGLSMAASVTARDIINNPTVLVDKVGLWKVKVRQETAEFPESNELGDIVIES